MNELKTKRTMRDYFAHSEIFLRLIGVWPYQYWLSQKLIRYLWLMQHISIMLPEGIKLVENKHDIDFATEAIPHILYHSVLFVKYANGVLNQHKIRSALEKVKDDWETIKNDEREENILRKYADTARFLNIAYIYLIFVVLLIFMFVPLQPILLDLVSPLNESRQKDPLFMVEFFIDGDKYFYTILIHAYITSLAGILPLFGTDIFLSNCVYHACGMLTILGHRVNNALMEKREMSNKDEYKELVQCILQHRSILEFCDDINKIYSTSFFYLLSLCIVLMSMTGALAVFRIGENFNDSIRFASSAIAQIFHMYCYNFMGQNLINFSDKLNAYIYSSRWYEASLKTKYAIQFMLLRSQKSTRIKAKIFPLSLENFTSVLKTSMSYFTVLKSTR